MPTTSDRVINSFPTDRAVEPPPGSTADRGFDVEPAVLTGAARNLDAEAGLLGDTVKDLEARLSQLGPCWSDDVVGQRFAARYEPAARTVVANITALSGGLGRIASALRAVADSYERADQIGMPSYDGFDLGDVSDLFAGLFGLFASTGNSANVGLGNTADPGDTIDSGDADTGAPAAGDSGDSGAGDSGDSGAGDSGDSGAGDSGDSGAE